MPRAGDWLPEEMAPFLQAHPHPDSSAEQLSAVGARNYRGQIWRPGEARDSPQGEWRDDAESAPGAARVRLYQAQHGPVYYALLVGLRSAFGVRDFLVWADLARIANVLFSALTAVLWFFILRRCFSEGPARFVPYVVCLALASNSLFAFTSARVANDGLANLLGTASLLLYFTLLQGSTERPGWRQGLGFLGLGLLTGAAACTKWNALALLPVYVLGVLVSCGIRRARIARGLGLAALCLVGVPAGRGSPPSREPPHARHDHGHAGSRRERRQRRRSRGSSRRAVLPAIQDVEGNVPLRSAPPRRLEHAQGAGARDDRVRPARPGEPAAAARGVDPAPVPPPDPGRAARTTGARPAAAVHLVRHALPRGELTTRVGPGLHERLVRRARRCRA